MLQATELETAARYWFKLARELADALRSGDPTALFEAKDDMEVFVKYTAHPGLKARAERALAGL